MAEDIEQLIRRVQEKYGIVKPRRKYVPAWAGEYLFKAKDGILDFLGEHKKFVAGVVGVVLLGAGAVGWLGVDYITKRQAYPIRRVLYQSQETVFFTGSEDPDRSRRDKKSETVIDKGNTDGTKIGDLLGLAKLRRSDELDIYEWENAEKTRIGYASEKREKFQGGLRIKGAIDFREQYAQLIGKHGNLITYTFVPERGTENIQLNVLVEADGKRRLANELVTFRSVPLGWLFGDVYRSGAAIYELPDSQKNQLISKRLFELIDKYDSDKALTGKQRESVIEEMLAARKQLERTPIIVSHEDGFLKILPQESSTFIFSDPSLLERLALGPWVTKQKQNDNVQWHPDRRYYTELRPIGLRRSPTPIKLRVENSWDLFPGDYWLLNRITVGTPPNVFKPFARYNNGGYTIKDGRGEVARVDITDSFLYYGQDVLYSYHLDKNGNGKLETNELIGQVLYRISSDQQGKLEQTKAYSRADVSKRYIYSFMSGHNWETRYGDFYLCNAIESFILNELNRGFSRHSELGWVNMQRSNIMFIENPTESNLGRVLAPESTLVAKWDIAALMRAAGRSFVGNYIVPVSP